MILVPRVAPAQESTFEEVLQPTHQPTEDKNDDSDESAKRGRPNEQLCILFFCLYLILTENRRKTLLFLGDSRMEINLSDHKIEGT